MSKKSTDGKLSYGQYKLADIMLFLLIMCVCEIVNVLAIRKWFPGMTFTVSVMLLVSLVVVIRWNWIGMIFPIADGAIYCWLLGATGKQFGVYLIGNAFVALVWLLFLVIPKEKITGSWLLTILYAVLGYLLLVLGRAVAGAIFGFGFGATFVGTLGGELLNFCFALAGLLILRKLDGMLADQKQYLIKAEKEREKLKPAEEERWDGYTELNDEDLQALAAMDEYDKAINFNNRSLNKLKERDGHEIEEDGDVGEDRSESDG